MRVVRVPLSRMTYFVVVSSLTNQGLNEKTKRNMGDHDYTRGHNGDFRYTPFYSACALFISQ